MRFYARPSWRLFWQVAADLFVVAWAIGWWFVGRLVDGTIRALAEPARQTARVTSDLRGQLEEAARQAGGVPVVGDGLRQPFDGMAGNLDGIIASANAQVAGLEQTALLLGWLLFLVPVALMVALWLPRRLRFAARARATLDLLQESDGTDLLALRALATQPLTELRAISATPARAWRNADASVIERLAELELVRSGVARPRRRRR